MIKISICTLVGFLLCAPSQAASTLIDLGNVTHDPNSGLDWLDVTETAGMSYNEVTLQLMSGGGLEGYRYATLTEIEGLLTAAGGTGPFTGDNQHPVDGWIAGLRALWGTTNLGSNALSFILWGEPEIRTFEVYEHLRNPITGDLLYSGGGRDGPQALYGFVTYTEPRVQEGLLQDFYGGNYATARFGFGVYDEEVLDYSGSTTGSALVFEGVPEPSSTALLGLGSLALMLRRRR